MNAAETVAVSVAKVARKTFEADGQVEPCYVLFTESGEIHPCRLGAIMNRPQLKDALNSVLRQAAGGIGPESAVAGVLISETWVSFMVKKPGDDLKQFRKYKKKVGCPRLDPERREAVWLIVEAREPWGDVSRCSAMMLIDPKTRALGPLDIKPVPLGGPLDGATRQLGVGIIRPRRPA